jgi:HEAT repeat protein
VIRAVDAAQAGIRRSALRRQLRAVVAGKSKSVSIDLEDKQVDTGVLVAEITNGHAMQSSTVQRLVVAFKNSGVADRAVERLASKNPQDRARSARLVGALRMYEAAPWVAEMLDARDRSVWDAAARALGLIGGGASATALLKAIHRRGLNRRLVAELARSAPDLFVESALRLPQPQAVRPALAIAAGLRRRRAAVAPLLELMEHGSRRERVISIRALGWIKATSATPMLIEALQDRDWKIRLSAAKALGRLRARSAIADLKYLQIDRNMRVRKAAANAVGSINRFASPEVARIGA